MVGANIRFTLRQLQYFVAVARTGQISLAAVESNVSQSAMTSAVAELERALGKPLFERHRTGVTLTYQGQQFLHHARHVLDTADEAAQHPFREERPLAGTLRLTASYTVLGYFLMPILARFMKLHPEVQIEPVEQTRARIESSVAADKFELAVALTSNFSDIARFGVLTLARSRRQLWVAPEHPLADAARVTLDQIAAYPAVLLLADEGDRAASRYWAGATRRPTALLRTTSMEAVREMVALGLGVTILSDMVYRPWSLDGRRIHAVPITDAVPPMEVGLVWRRGRHLSPIADALRRYLRMAAEGPGLR